MSKAFLRESDSAPLPDLPPPVSPLPAGAKNYMTAAGAEQLRAQLSALTDGERPSLLAESSSDPEAKQALQKLDRRIRYLRESLRTAEIVEPSPEAEGVVKFGTEVEVREPGGETSRYRIVGVDEADPAQGWVSWTSPLARALINARVGDHVKFSTPAGPSELEIVRLLADPVTESAHN